MRVYYLTSEEHAISNIQLRRIKVSLIDDLNDPFELLAIHMGDREQRKIWGEFRKYFTTKAGLVCFSSQWKNPVMWSHYGDKHKGICLGFDVDDKILKKVTYLKSRMKYQIGSFFSGHKITPEILNEVVRYKFKEWWYEREYRGIVPLKEKDISGLYFVDFNKDFMLREVIIGARSALVPKQFSQMLSEYDQQVTVKKARLAFRSFTVVQNQAIPVYKNA
ncbi:MAG: DUF2971 domain-containing protein [Candidatus Thiodiazotropha sp.]